jgi:uncharacterized protein (DUF427 family)
MTEYPAALVEVNHVEPVPRRIRAVLGGETVLDTLGARYVWEWPAYPQYYIPRGDVRPGLLIPEAHQEETEQGTVEHHAIHAGDVHRPGAARLVIESPVEGLAGTVRFDWAAMEAWYEEDEEVFVHPRNPYSRVDALRSTRRVQVELDGVPLADSSSTIMVFETGLPTRYYFNRTEVHFKHLVPTDTVTACPYKGETGGYWSARIGDAVHQDVAWTYTFPTHQLLPIAGLIAFYNEFVDLTVDGRRLERPMTVFSRSKV